MAVLIYIPPPLMPSANFRAVCCRPFGAFKWEGWGAKRFWVVEHGRGLGVGGGGRFRSGRVCCSLCMRTGSLYVHHLPPHFCLFADHHQSNVKEMRDEEFESGMEWETPSLPQTLTTTTPSHLRAPKGYNPSDQQPRPFLTPPLRVSPRSVLWTVEGPCGGGRGAVSANLEQGWIGVSVFVSVCVG